MGGRGPSVLTRNMFAHPADSVLAGEVLPGGSPRTSRDRATPVGVTRPGTVREVPGMWCARGELNRRTFTLDQAQTAALSVNPVSRCLRLTPVSSGVCTPGVHQPPTVESIQH